MSPRLLQRGRRVVYRLLIYARPGFADTSRSPIAYGVWQKEGVMAEDAEVHVEKGSEERVGLTIAIG